jgi:hypothetical protein
MAPTINNVLLWCCFMQHQMFANRQGCHDSEFTLVHPLDTAVLRNWQPKISQRIQMCT